MKKITILLFISLLTSSLMAATFTVNTTTDENDGSCIDGDCSLRDAIALANGNGQADDIIIPDGTYTLDLGTQLTITSDINLLGTSQNGTIIQAHVTEGSATHRVIEVNTAGTDVAFSDLTIRHGKSMTLGGGIYCNNISSATLTNVTISDNQIDALGGTGAGIQLLQVPSVIITNSIIKDNTILFSAGSGGGIDKNGGTTFTMSNSLVDNNSAG